MPATIVKFHRRARWDLEQIPEPEQQAVRDGKNGGVGPDANGERQHGDDGEPAGFEQRTKGVAEVGHGGKNHSWRRAITRWRPAGFGETRRVGGG